MGAHERWHNRPDAANAPGRLSADGVAHGELLPMSHSSAETLDETLDEVREAKGVSLEFGAEPELAPLRVRKRTTSLCPWRRASSRGVPCARARQRFVLCVHC